MEVTFHSQDRFPFNILVYLNDNLFDIKKKIEGSQNIPISMQTLVYNGAVLTDEFTVLNSELHFEPQPHIQLVVNVPDDEETFQGLETLFNFNSDQETGLEAIFQKSEDTNRPFVAPTPKCDEAPKRKRYDREDEEFHSFLTAKQEEWNQFLNKKMEEWQSWQSFNSAVAGPTAKQEEWNQFLNKKMEEWQSWQSFNSAVAGPSGPSPHSNSAVAGPSGPSPHSNSAVASGPSRSAVARTSGPSPHSNSAVAGTSGPSRSAVARTSGPSPHSNSAVAGTSGPSRSAVAGPSRPSRSAVARTSGPSRSPYSNSAVAGAPHSGPPNMCKVTVEARGGIRFQLEVDPADQVEKLKEGINQFYRDNNLNHYFLSHQRDGQTVYLSFENLIGDCGFSENSIIRIQDFTF